MNKLMITEVQIIPVKPRDGLIGFASLVMNNQIYIGSLGIHTSPSSQDGFRLVYPQKILSTGKQINCVHPINREAGDVIKRAVISKYMQIISNIDQID